jgi:hypothetical protein
VGGERGRNLARCAREEDPFAGEPIKSRRARAGGPVAADRVLSKRVDRDEEKVRAVARRFGPAREKREKKKKRNPSPCHAAILAAKGAGGKGTSCPEMVAAEMGRW